MYPFNRIRDFRAKTAISSEICPEASTVIPMDFTLPNNNADDSEASSPEAKMFLASVMEYSTSESDHKFRTRFASLTEEKTNGFYGITRNIHTVINGLRPILMLLRLMGFFPRVAVLSRRHPCRKKLLQILFTIYTLFIIGFNCYIYYYNFVISKLYSSRFGLMHAATVAHLIAGVKPIINIGLLTLFLWRAKKHVKMIKMMDTTDLCFRSTFNKTPNVKFYSTVFYICLGVFLIVPFSWRIHELIQLHKMEVSSDTLIAQLWSVVVVPILTAWNVIPLMYYVYCNMIIRYWCRVLRKSLKKEHIKRHFSLKFYYEQFLRITSLQEAVGNLFNPIIFLNLAWSLILLCLTIYFITQPTSTVTEPITLEQAHSQELRTKLNNMFLLNLGWSLLQIFVATFHICAISATGMRTNEETRKILSAVLGIVPDANADLDRFQISCFVHKMSTQYMWGMTVWRAFPLERTTFFTLVSVIVTYSLLLLKLKENPHISPRVPMLMGLPNGTDQG